jgi:hypothetical protein
VDDTPKIISESFASPDADNFKEADRSKMNSILSNGTLELVDSLDGCKLVCSKWVLRTLGLVVLLISTRQYL